jgi:hypothetical protein
MNSIGCQALSIFKFNYYVNLIINHQKLNVKIESAWHR